MMKKRVRVPLALYKVWGLALYRSNARLSLLGEKVWNRIEAELECVSPASELELDVSPAFLRFLHTHLVRFGTTESQHVADSTLTMMKETR